MWSSWIIPVRDDEVGGGHPGRPRFGSRLRVTVTCEAAIRSVRRRKLEWAHWLPIRRHGCLPPYQHCHPNVWPQGPRGSWSIDEVLWNGGKQVHRSARWVAGIGPLVRSATWRVLFRLLLAAGHHGRPAKNAAPPSRHVQFRSCGPLRCGHGAVGPGDRLGAIATCSACSHGVEVVGSTEWHCCNRYVVPGCARWSGCIRLCGGARGSSVVQGWVE